MNITFKSISANEAFARISVAAFVSSLDPTLEEINEIKTVVSEAVTNAIIHGYEENPHQTIAITCTLSEDNLTVIIEDFGLGINNIDLAKQPLYTSKPELERSGMGFTIMENFMDKVEIHSVPDEGTKVTMVKEFKKSKTLCN